MNFRQMTAVTLLTFGTISLNGCVTIHNFNEGRYYYAQQNYELALKKLTKAAKWGNVQAQYAVGYMYYTGCGTLRNELVGRQWIKKAADKNYRPAVEALRLLRAQDKIPPPIWFTTPPNRRY